MKIRTESLSEMRLKIRPIAALFNATLECTSETDPVFNFYVRKWSWSGAKILWLSIDTSLNNQVAQIYSYLFGNKINDALKIIQFLEKDLNREFDLIFVDKYNRFKHI